MMIVELLLTVVGALVSALGAIIPDVPMPFSDELSDFAVFVGSTLGGLNAFLPITEVAVVVGWALTVYLPFVITYVSIRWIVSHVPAIGGS